MQCSVHPPPPFIQAHLDRLLPAWHRPVQSVLVVLQHCNSALWERTLETEVEKDQLRQQFMQLGWQIASQLQQLQHLVEVIDPQTGLPTLSQAGSLKLDVVRVVDACLGYTIAPSGTCKVVVHPTWGSAVYPAIILSSAQPSILQDVIDRLVLQDRFASVPPLPDSFG